MHRLMLIGPCPAGTLFNIAGLTSTCHFFRIIHVFPFIVWKTDYWLSKAVISLHSYGTNVSFIYEGIYWYLPGAMIMDQSYQSSYNVDLFWWRWRPWWRPWRRPSGRWGCSCHLKQLETENLYVKFLVHFYYLTLMVLVHFLFDITYQHK